MEKVIDYETESGDRMVSIAEVQAAYKTAVLKTEDKFYRPTLEAFLTELTKPPEPRLRDDCPVMYDTPSNKGVLGFTPLIGRNRINIRPLLPIEEAREIARRAMEYRVPEPSRTEAMGLIDRYLAAYITEPSDE